MDCFESCQSALQYDQIKVADALMQHVFEHFAELNKFGLDGITTILFNKSDDHFLDKISKILQIIDNIIDRPDFIDFLDKFIRSYVEKARAFKPTVYSCLLKNCNKNILDVLWSGLSTYSKLLHLTRNPKIRDAFDHLFTAGIEQMHEINALKDTHSTLQRIKPKRMHTRTKRAK
jgi:hypothetical protein